MARREDECRYCGKKGVHGNNCSYSPNGFHKEVGDEDHCIYCGSTGYGTNCTYSDTIGRLGPIHVHGRGRKCIYCGSTTHGANCPYSPNGYHEF